MILSETSTDFQVVNSKVIPSEAVLIPRSCLPCMDSLHQGSNIFKGPPKRPAWTGSHFSSSHLNTSSSLKSGRLGGPSRATCSLKRSSRERGGNIKATLRSSQLGAPRDEEEEGKETNAAFTKRQINQLPHRFLQYLGNIPLPSPSLTSNIRSFRSMDKGDPIEDSPIFDIATTDAEAEFPNASHSLKEVDVAGADKFDVYSLPLSMKLEHPTIQVLEQRWKSKSKPGNRSDGLKVGLVVEGGGMRGAVTGGMLMQLHSIGLKDAFDVVYGSSAGAVNATYFLSDQDNGLDVYFHHLPNADFMSFKRVFSRDPVMNLDYLLNDVMHKRLPLDWNKVLKSDIPLKVVASCLDALSAVTLEGFESQKDLVDALWASANVPEIAGPPRVFKGRRLVDAAVFEPIPYRAAIKDGCSHVLALCSRPRFRSSNRGAVRKAMKSLVTLAVKRVALNPPYMRAAWEAEVMDIMKNGGINWDDALLLAMMDGLQGATPDIGGHIFPLYPSPELHISPTCLDADTLREGALDGRRAIDNLFSPIVESARELYSV